MGKKNEIQTVNCNEVYLMKPFSTGVGAGSYTSVRYVFAAVAVITFYLNQRLSMNVEMNKSALDVCFKRSFHYRCKVIPEVI